MPADRMATNQSGPEFDNQIDEIEGSIVDSYHDSFFEKSQKQLELPVKVNAIKEYEESKRDLEPYVRFNSASLDKDKLTQVRLDASQTGLNPAFNSPYPKLSE